MRPFRHAAALAALLLASACVADAPTQPGTAPTASVPVAANVAAVTASGALAVQVSAADIATPVAASFPVTAGIVSGELTKIPVGKARTVSATLKNLADSVLAAGEATVDIVPGKNPTLRLTLHVQGQAPGRLPIEITIDTVVVEPSDPVPPPAGAFVVPELPRATPSATIPQPTRSTSVPAGANLQAAIDAAQPGDELVLAGGATYSGNFVLPFKAGAGWVSIRSSGAPPPAGTRVTPASAAGFAKIVTPNADPALRTAPGARGYRLLGLEVTTTAGQVYSLISLGDAGPAQATLASVPRDLVLDRVYVHGTATVQMQRCVALNSASTALVDSYLADCHIKGFDSQAVWGSNGPGPFLIENNYLEGAGENVMFGGADSRAPELMPGDITIRRNAITKPAAWQGVWSVKNLVELKAARRVLIEGNVLEGSWVDAQGGFAILLKSVNQECGAPWSETADVTVRRNTIARAEHGISLAERPETCPAVPMSRVLIADNGLTVRARPITVQGVADLTITHNTAASTGGLSYLAALSFNAGVSQRLTFTANDFTFAACAPLDGFCAGLVTSGDDHGVDVATGKASGDAVVSYHATGAAIAGNRLTVLGGGKVATWNAPSTNGPPAADVGVRAP